jgi:hypothetical protein
MTHPIKSDKEQAFDLLDNYDGTEEGQSELIRLLALGIERDRQEAWDRAYRAQLAGNGLLR